jgi:hypothetical protein
MSRLLLLWLHLLAVRALAPSQAAALYADVVSVSEAEEPLYTGEFGRARTALVLMEWAARESAGYKHVVGKAGDCGRGQLLFLPSRRGHTCDELRAGGTLDLELALSWMRDMRDACGGSVTRGLAAYARGACRSEEGLEIVRHRLSEIEAVQ